MFTQNITRNRRYMHTEERDKKTLLIPKFEKPTFKTNANCVLTPNQTFE